jgi:hypothetical protein
VLPCSIYPFCHFASCCSIKVSTKQSSFGGAIKLVWLRLCFQCMGPKISASNYDRLHIILNFVCLVHHGSSHCILSGIYNVWFQTLIREVCIAFKISLLGTIRAWIKTMLYLISHCVLIFLQKSIKVVDNLAAHNFGLEGWDFLFFIFWRMTSLLWNLMLS